MLLFPFFTFTFSEINYRRSHILAYLDDTIFFDNISEKTKFEVMALVEGQQTRLQASPDNSAIYRIGPS